MSRARLFLTPVLVLLLTALPAATNTQVSGDPTEALGEPGKPPVAPTTLDSLILRAIEATVQHRYPLAQSLLVKAADLDPQDPLPVLLRAASLHARMQDLENYAQQAEFLALLDSARALALRIQTQGPSAHASFCLGTIEAYLAYTSLREGRPLAAYRHGLRARGYFQETLRLDSSNCDAAVGVGSFVYWRGKALRYVSWLPFVYDPREQGIRTILDVLPCTHLTRWTALSNLSWILLDAGRPHEALRWAEVGLQHFPDSRFFLWPAAEALFRLGRWQEAEATYRKILVSLSEEKGSSGYNEVLCHLRIAECRSKTGDLVGALESLDHALIVPVGDGTRKELDEALDRAQRLRRRLAHELSQQRPVP